MSKKLVVSLFAGAVLLSAGPAFAAGIVNGTCDNCHTMHNSQDGGTIQTGQFDMLLKGNGCVGCHAQPGVLNVSGTGMSSGTGNVKAPQVDDSVTPLNGGYFLNNGTQPSVTEAPRQHNVSDLGHDADAAMLAGKGVAGGAQPGGAATDVPGGLGNTGPGNAALTCQGCHTQAGHHDVDANTYRMLSGTNTSTRNVNYGNDTDGVDARNLTVYDGGGMNAFCASCHGTFHTDTNGSIVGENWTRHPTDIAMTGLADAPSVAQAVTDGYDSTTDVSAVVVGNGGGNNDIVMCISCHLPHGGDYADLLAFDYSAQDAGDGARTEGCETCHSYTTVGM